MTVNEFLAKYRKKMYVHSDIGCVRPRVRCADGYSVSIQAGWGLYSTPREDANGYTKVELGYPSCADECIMEYAENVGNPVDSIYAYVPIEVVEKLLESHGGIVGVDLSNDPDGVWRDAE